MGDGQHRCVGIEVDIALLRFDDLAIFFKRLVGELPQGFDDLRIGFVFFAARAPAMLAVSGVTACEVKVAENGSRSPGKPSCTASAVPAG